MQRIAHDFRVVRFLIHYGWRGTIRLARKQHQPDLFLIHYGWRGTGEMIPETELEKMFLIHYGWRGTFRTCSASTSRRSFLIHYGWRGTAHLLGRLFGYDHVSNPLRLEGDLCWSSVEL